MGALFGVIAGFIGWFLVRYLLAGIFTVDQNELAVLTTFGKAHRISERTTLDDPMSKSLSDEERERYAFPKVEIIRPGGPYFAWPWQKVHKVSIATQTANMALDPEDPTANHGGTSLEAVTKDQLNISIKGQIRFKASEKNLYAYLFGVKQPLVHVMGYFISILRERIANFENPQTEKDEKTAGISINDLRKNLQSLNEAMFQESRSSMARYGITLEASLITAIDPPKDVESALAAINTAHNEVSSDISLAQASADQRLVQSQKAVEIETLRAEAEVEPLVTLAAQLGELKKSNSDAIPAYLRNMRKELYKKARHTIVEVQ
ncbi:MAG: SPFH domain-containing protein [Candidatus Riflebacteria bacterium]|nr:SPFH domain-containing protein [Candidatus Riflebacteria bacterium]